MDLVDDGIIQDGVVNPDLVQMHFSDFLKHFLFEFVRSWDEQVIINQSTRKRTCRNFCYPFCLLIYCVVGCEAVLWQYSWISFIFILFEITKITLFVVMNQ